MPVTPHLSRNLATQLAEALSAFSWGSVAGGTIAATMQRKPDYGLEDLGSLRVSVVPGPYTMKTETRGMELADTTVGIVVAKHGRDPVQLHQADRAARKQRLDRGEQSPALRS